MASKNPRLSQQYPEEMTELGRLLEQVHSRIPPTNPRTMRVGSDPDRCLRDFRERLQRARNEFDALLFFTVCFGMLKSGKSTLVNLLAGHEEASPTRFGQDTTLRPCLILAGDTDEIVTFHMTDAVKGDESGEAEKRCFNAVIDHLRGVIEIENLTKDHHVVVRRMPFSNDNIVKALCTPEGFGSEPLITVVIISDASDLLRSEIALLDVPGLDSDQMRPEIERYIELLERCDLLVFIQSTVSALNHDAASMLRNLVKRSKGSPVWLIQNRFEAQTWRKPEELEAQDSRLVNLARQNLGKALSIPDRTIFTKQVNLGKAYDAQFRKSMIADELSSDQLLEESGFGEVVSELSKKINEERLDIQLANCLGELATAVERNRESLAELETWIRKEREGLFAFREDFNRLVQKFSSKTGFVPIPQGEDGPGEFDRRTRELVQTHADRWKGEMAAHLGAWKSEIREQMAGDEFNSSMDEHVRNEFDYGPNEVFSLHSSFGSGIAEIFRWTVEKSPSYKALTDEAMEAMLRHDVPPLDWHIADWVAEDGPLDLGITAAVPNRVKGGRNPLTLWITAQTVEVETCKAKINECENLLKDAIDRYAKRLVGDQIHQWFRRYRDEQLADFFNIQVRERKATKEAVGTAAAEEFDRLSGYLPGLRSALDEIDDFTRSFRMKLNLPSTRKTK
jgi:hypothetical protein